MWYFDELASVPYQKKLLILFVALHYKYTKSLLDDVFLCLPSIQSRTRVSKFSDPTVPLYNTGTAWHSSLSRHEKVSIVCISESFN